MLATRRPCGTQKAGCVARAATGFVNSFFVSNVKWVAASTDGLFVHMSVHFENFHIFTPLFSVETLAHSVSVHRKDRHESSGASSS